MGLAPGLLPGRVASRRAGSGSPRPGARCPSSRGLDTAGILAAMAGDEPADGPPVRALVLLGADPLTDFPDRGLAETALSAGADFVVAVTGHPSELGRPSTPTWCCPCAVAHERPGTTTNIEGRVSRLGQKLTAPGFAWPDWMIAAELAVHLGADLGVDQRRRPGRRDRAHWPRPTAG